MSQVAALALALKKLIGLGISAWTAVNEAETPTETRALRELVDAGLCIGALRETEALRAIAACQFVLIARAFGEALNRQWYGREDAATGISLHDRFERDDVGRSRAARIERRLHGVAAALHDAPGLYAGEDVGAVSALLGDPVKTPYYRRLFRAFFDPSLGRTGEETLMAPLDRRAFERHFRLAYAEGLTTAPGAPIRQHVVTFTDERARVVRALCIQDIAGWGSRHVLGVVADHAGLSPLPLGALHVEPEVTIAGVDGAVGEPEQAFALLDRLIEQHPLVVVRADAGVGKSLLARSLAWRRARACVEVGGSPSDARTPIFVDCAVDIEGPLDDFALIARCAQARHARALLLDVDDDDDAFAMPDDESPALFLIDGLEAAQLGDAATRRLVAWMREQGAPHRFVALSRPAALPSRGNLADVPVLDLLPLRSADDATGGQIGEWLRRFSLLTSRSPALTNGSLASKGLLALAGTPVALFLIADTWDRDIGRKPSLGEFYEAYLRKVAERRCAADEQRDAAQTWAASKLRDRLCELRHLPAEAGIVDAVVWLMGWVAWKAKCVEDTARFDGQKEAFDAHHVRAVLRKELRLADDEEAARALDLAFLLAPEVSLAKRRSRIVFGHASFREFLVGRYWAHRLRRLIEQGNRKWELEEDEPLLGGRLLGRDDASFRFFLHEVARWTGPEREELAAWAQRCFNDERPVRNAKGMRADRRALLRETALAIGSAASQGRGLKAKDERTLRSLLAWFWLHEEDAIVLAQKLESPRASLQGAKLVGADLRSADLAGVDLRGADLQDADLSRANLKEADLRGAILSRARLYETNLAKANLRGAFFVGSSLRRANFTGADLRDAELSHADLSYAELRSADLRGAHMHGANMGNASITGGTLSDGDFPIADLGAASTRGDRP